MFESHFVHQVCNALHMRNALARRSELHMASANLLHKASARPLLERIVLLQPWVFKSFRSRKSEVLKLTAIAARSTLPLKFRSFFHLEERPLPAMTFMSHSVWLH